MKKITLVAALLGSAYFANAQVGIGTPSPATSSMLDVVSSTKGVLIPRVSLTDKGTFAPMTGTSVNSLLVYNTNTTTHADADRNVTPGFYYWSDTKWERIISHTDLVELIEGNVELENIINLLQTAYPANNLNGSTTTGNTFGGGMVYTPASGSDDAKIEYVFFNGTSYVKQDMTDILNDLIDIEAGNVIYDADTQIFKYWNGSSYVDIPLEDIVKSFETKTKIATIQGKQFYFAENFTGTIPTTIPATLPTGMYLIDVVGGVVNNFNEIANSQITVNNVNYNSLTEYIEEISQNNLADGVSKIVITGGQASFQKWNNTTNTWEDVTTASFSSIVKANETKTTFDRRQGTSAYAPAVTTEPAAQAGKVVYKYNAENTTQYLDITADVLESITNNQFVREAIFNILNAGGNVYYGDHDNNASTPNVLYHVVGGVNTPIVLPVDIEQLITTITNATEVQKNNIKFQLGDKINNNTSVFTGNTITIDNIVYYIYKGVFDTTVTANTAQTTGVTLDRAANIILSATLKYQVGTNTGLTASLTDIAGSDTSWAMNVGVGTMYNVLSSSNVDAQVILEFATTTVPTGLVVNP